MNPRVGLGRLAAVSLTAALGWSCYAAEIVVGQSAALSGNQAQFGLDAQIGTRIAFDAANRTGGIKGKTIRLVSIDDGGKRAEVVDNTKRLFDDYAPVALIGYTSGAGVEAALPLLESHGVPMVGPLTGNAGIRAAFHRNLFHVRAGYGDEMARLARDLKAQGLSRFALVYLNDVGPANAETMRTALRTLSAQAAVAEEAIDRNASSYAAVAERLVRARPEAILTIVNGTALAQLAIELRRQHYAGVIATSSFAGDRFAVEAGAAADGVVITQVLPPLRKHYIKLIKDMHTDLASAGVKTAPSTPMLEAYVAARVLIEGLRRCANPTSSEELVRALESIKRLDLGGFEIEFRADDHQGSRYVDTAVMARGAFIN